MPTYITPSATNFVVGTGVNTPPASLVNTLNALTPVEILPVVADQWSNLSVVLSWMTRQGKKFRNVAQLVYALATGEDPSGGAFTGLQLLTPVPIDNIQPATQVWRTYGQPCAIPTNDVILNSGVTGAIDLVSEKVNLCATSLLQKMSRAMYHVAPQNTSLDIDDIDSWVAQSTNTIAGISRSANAFWKPQTALAASGAALGTQLLNKGYFNCTNNFDEPDTLLLANLQYQAFIQPFFSQNRYVDQFPDNEGVQLGFRRKVLFNTAMVLMDNNIPQTGTGFPKGYLFTSRYLQPVFHPLDYFTMDPFIKPSNQRALVTCLYVTWQLCDFRPASAIAFTGLNTT